MCPRKRYLFILKRFFKSVHIEMVGNYTFKTKWPILTICRNMPISVGTNRCVDLNSASIYSSYNIILQSFCNIRCNKIPVVIDLFIRLGIYLGSKKQNKTKQNKNKKKTHTHTHTHTHPTPHTHTPTQNTLYFEKTIGHRPLPFQLSPLHGILVHLCI